MAIHIRRREFIFTLGGAAAAWPLAARAQQRERMRRIGVLCLGRGRSGIQAWSGHSCRGWSNWAGPSAATCGSTPLGQRCRSIRRPQRNWSRSRRTSFWPLVPSPSGRCCRRPAPCRSCSRDASDPVGAGFVDSLARPGGNATGFMNFEYSLSGKWLELLKQIAPGMTRAAVLRDPTVTCYRSQFGASSRSRRRSGSRITRSTCAMPAISSAPSPPSREEAPA